MITGLLDLVDFIHLKYYFPIKNHHLKSTDITSILKDRQLWLGGQKKRGGLKESCIVIFTFNYSSTIINIKKEKSHLSRKEKYKNDKKQTKNEI